MTLFETTKSPIASVEELGGNKSLVAGRKNNILNKTIEISSGMHFRTIVSFFMPSTLEAPQKATHTHRIRKITPAPIEKRRGKVKIHFDTVTCTERYPVAFERFHDL